MAEPKIFEGLADKIQNLDNRFQNLKNKLEKKAKEGKQGLGLEEKPKPKLKPIPPKGWKGKKEEK